MDQLKNFYAQLKDLFLGMTPGNRITVALLLAGLLLSVAFLFISLPASEGKYVPAFGGKFFDQSQQITVSAALAKANLSDYDWKEGKLIVPKNEVNKYIGAITEAKAVVGLGDHQLQAIDKMGAYETRLMIEKRSTAAKQQELRTVLMNWSWIREASVITNERSERDRNLYDKKSVPSVAVTVWPHNREEINEEQRSAITAVVKTSFGITDLNDITITDGNTWASFYGSDDKIRGGARTYEDMQRHYQDEWDKKIKEHFADISGLRVSTVVKLNDSLGRTVHDVRHDRPTAVSVRERTTDLDKKDRDIAGRPGLTPQLGLPVPNPQAQVIQGSSVKETTEETERNMALQGEEGQSRIAGLTPKTITASLRVPISYFKKVWIERNTKPGEPTPEPTDADIASIQVEILASIRKSTAKLMETLRPSDMPDTTQMVDVEPYDDFRPAIDEKPTLAQMVMAWLGINWETLSLLALVLVGMGVLWSMTRVRQPEPIVIYEAAQLPMEEVPMTDEEIAAQEAEEGIKRSLEPFSKSIISLQSEVADLVTENPDAAASVLRQWIGNVAFQE